jgi:hypothetical protein
MPTQLLTYAKLMHKTKIMLLFDNSSTKPYLFVFLKPLKKYPILKKNVQNTEGPL